MAKNNVISDRTWQGHQSWNREVIENIGGKRVRLTVKVDAYDFQSWAKAELWSGDKWNTIHHIPAEVTDGNSQRIRIGSLAEALDGRRKTPGQLT